MSVTNITNITNAPTKSKAATMIINGKRVILAPSKPQD